MKILLRVMLILNSAFLGFMLMASLGGRFLVDKSEGLAGGVMVLGYGLFGTLVCLGIATFLSFKLPLARLRNLTISISGLAFVILILTILNFQKIKESRLDPESAYAGLPHFSITLQQTKIIDPVLSTRHTINTTEKKWTSTLPDGRICKGTLSASAHKAISQSLLKINEAGNSSIQNCLQTTQDTQKELQWKFLNQVEGIQKGRLEISQACLDNNPHMAQLINEISKANISTKSAVKCK